MIDLKSIANFFFEIGILKETPRAGWARVGIEKAESVADHAYRATLIGYALADLEGEDPKHVACMLLFSRSFVG